VVNNNNIGQWISEIVNREKAVQDRACMATWNPEDVDSVYVELDELE
jgi:hypothetical protein